MVVTDRSAVVNWALLRPAGELCYGGGANQNPCKDLLCQHHDNHLMNLVKQSVCPSMAFGDLPFGRCREAGEP